MTTGFPATAWFYWIGGGVFALFGLMLMYSSLLRDRSRGRRRCPRCWYDMSGTAALGILTCSECGKTVRRERHLRRTRRRWTKAFLAAVLILLGYVSYVYPRAERDGWINAAPTTARILLNPYIDIPTTRVTTSGLWGGSATSTTTDLISHALDERLESAAVKDPRWCGLQSWQWWLLLRQARSRERDATQSSSVLPPDLKEEFYDRVVFHALRCGFEKPEWPFREYAERARTCVAITGSAMPRLGRDRIQWAIRRQSTEFCRHITINATPLGPPADSIGIWLPREIALSHNDLAYWTTDAIGPAENQDVVFEVLLGIGEGYGNSSTDNRPQYRLNATYLAEQTQTAQSSVDHP